MGLGNKAYAVTDATGASVSIARSDKNEVILRNIGPNTCYLAWNETAVDTVGIYLKIDDTIVLTGQKCDADIYMVCASGETASVRAQITI